jgi:hypothetical protein
LVVLFVRRETIRGQAPALRHLARELNFISRALGLAQHSAAQVV